MKNYVDLHAHSFRSKSNGDVIHWDSYRQILMTLKKNNVKAFCFSDHDYFDYEIYCEINKTKNEKNMDITIFPAVEITIKRKNNELGHILFIFDNKTTDDKLEKLESLIYNNSSSQGIMLNQIITELKQNNYNFFLIPHIGKDHSVQYEDIKDYIDLVYYIESPSNKRELNKFYEESNTKIRNLMFSDTHHWNNYKGSCVFIDNDIINFDTIKTCLFFEEENYGK